MSDRCPCCGRADSNRTSLLAPWVCYCGALLRADRRVTLIWGSILIAGLLAHPVAIELDLVALDPLGGALVVAGVLGLILMQRTRVLKRGPVCVSCHYDLSAVPRGAPCPECGRLPPESW